MCVPAAAHIEHHSVCGALDDVLSTRAVEDVQVPPDSASFFGLVPPAARMALPASRGRARLLGAPNLDTIPRLLAEDFDVFMVQQQPIFCVCCTFKICAATGRRMVSHRAQTPTADSLLRDGNLTDNNLCVMSRARRRSDQSYKPCQVEQHCWFHCGRAAERASSSASGHA